MTMYPKGQAEGRRHCYGWILFREGGNGRGQVQTALVVRALLVRFLPRTYTWAKANMHAW